MCSGAFVFPAIDRIVYGQPATEALRAEVGRLGADRVFLVVSGTMNRTTDESIAHGHTSCVMLPHVLRYNHSANAEKPQLVTAA